jgi:hypothetical protein
VLAERGSEGWESLEKYVEKENEEVVGSVNGKGMVGRMMSKRKGPSGVLAASQLCYAMLTTRLGLSIWLSVEI